MTTAHRPTFHAAIGGKEQGGGRYIAGVSRQHVHDLPGQLSVKTRQPGQGTQADLEARPTCRARGQGATHLKAIGKAVAGCCLAPTAPTRGFGRRRRRRAGAANRSEDADDNVVTRPGAVAVSSSRAGGASSSDAGGAAAAESEDDEEEDDEEDEEEELMRELERIKKERAAEAAKKAKEASDEAAAELDSSILQSNPLLDPTKLGAGSSFAVKRRWDDDVVFKNQSREPKKEGKRFINDTVRNDFHKRFLSKYVK